MAGQKNTQRRVIFALRLISPLVDALETHLGLLLNEKREYETQFA